MGWFGLTKAAPKLADNMFDKEKGLLTQVGNWVGNGKFTAEEQAELNSSNMKAVQAFVIATLEENTDRSKARREIAVFFIRFFALLIFMTGMTYPISPEWSAVWFSLATAGSVGGLVVAISVFFFGSHAVARHHEAKK